MTVYVAGAVVLVVALYLLDLNNVAVDPVVRLAVLLVWLPLVGPTLARWTVRRGWQQSARVPEQCWGTDPLPGPVEYDSYIGDTESRA